MQFAMPSQPGTHADHSLNELIARKRRREKRHARRRVISSGWKANILSSICLIGSLVLCLAHFEHLQADADYKLVEFHNLSFGDQAEQNLRNVVRHGHVISAVMFFLHILAIKTSKTRFTFTSLLALFAWPINAFLHIEQNHSHDYLISRIALSAFTMIIQMAILFLPKKLKRRKRPNTFYSAFSLASTPTSQQSSQLNLSQCSVGNRTIDFDDNATIFSDNRSYRTLHTNTIANGTAGMMRNRNYGSQSTIFNGNNEFGRHNSDGMSLRSGRTYASGSTQSTMFSKPKKSMDWREKRRESTPMREVRELIDDLLINNSTEEESSDDDIPTGSRLMREKPNQQKTTPNMLSTGAISPSRSRKPGHAPFSSLTFNPAVFKQTSSSKSVASTAASSSQLYLNGSPKSAYTYGGGSSCSSLSVNSSPFRKHL